MALNYYDEETILKAVKEERQYIQRNKDSNQISKIEATKQ